MNASYVGLSRLAMTAINASGQRNSAPPRLLSIPLPTEIHTITAEDLIAEKPVYRLSCKDCSAPVCARAWLMDGELTFSTDTSSEGISMLHDRIIEERFHGLDCSCIFCEMCCRECGNELGYHVVTVRAGCMLRAYFKQNLWIFKSCSCNSIERRNVNKEIMVYRELPKPEDEHEDYLLGDENPYEQPWR